LLDAAVIATKDNDRVSSIREALGVQVCVGLNVDEFLGSDEGGDNLLVDGENGEGCSG
jgi:hypothetical protein